MNTIPPWLTSLIVLALTSSIPAADDPRVEVEVVADQADDESSDLAAGHSRHGEVFNEGPRQQAYLMPGMGSIVFEVTTANPLVRKFIEQGIGQLHGFWYFEAERSFRQAAMLDPTCAMAYWGMSKANENNAERAQGFIQRALELIDNASPREQAYITAHHAFLTGKDESKQREAAYVNAVTKITQDFPDDLEAKALLGFLLYKYRVSAGKSHSEVDVVLDQVLAKAKNHPVHHYRIHNWDQQSPQRALDSAALCGPAADGIAHMWHMCGHIFSRVKRFGDAAWFQEASARVDHRHMMHDMVLPDQIHNFAHNNEWLIRDLMNVGRVRDALELAKNMIELPRHPKYNTLDGRQSASYGRDRLFDVLERFELWNELVTLADTPYLDPTEKADQQVKRLRLLGMALAQLGRVNEAEEVRAKLLPRLEELRQQPLHVEQATAVAETDEEPQDTKAAEEKRKKERERQQEEREQAEDRIAQAIACIDGYLQLHQRNYAAGAKLLREAEEDELAIARAELLAGEVEQAIKLAEDYVKQREQQVQPLAGLIEIYAGAGRREQARAAFVRLRSISNWLEVESPIFARLTPIAVDLGFPADWRVQLPDPADVGKQPALATLGPFRWRPVHAADWLLPDSKGQLISLRDYRGKPLIVVFYLGYGCLHCAEQLHALAPKTADFAREGISIVAISSDNLAGLAISQENYEGDEIPFPLVANPELDVFKSYRCFDDFEDLPLHGTFLIDGRGDVRWQDISYDPFMDIDFLLAESKRLLRQDVAPIVEAPRQELTLRK